MPKVLVVEDRPDQRDILAQMLELNGYQIAMADNAIDGIELAHSWLPELILMDLRLPHMGGFAVIKILRQDPNSANIPIFAFAWASGATKERAFAAGANEYFTKPINLTQLLTSINLYLNYVPTADQSSTSSGSTTPLSMSALATPSFSRRDIPYIAGPPVINPKMFFGRQADLDKIIGLLASNFVMLIGQRRIGKTSLLHQLAHRLPQLKETPQKFLPVLINVEGTQETEFFHMIMEEIVNSTKKYVPSEVAANLSFDIHNLGYTSRAFSRDLQAVLGNLQSTTPKPTHLVLLLDEMDTFNGYSLETQSQLRRIFQRFPNHNLSVVVAGVNLQQQWAGESSPFYNMFVPVILNPFPEVEARRLITEPIKEMYNYNDEAVARILEATLGLPHRIQQLCLEIVNHLLTSFKGYTGITAEHVNTVLQTIHWLDESERSIEVREFEHEFEIAQRVQEALLPQLVPQVPGLEISGRILMARHIGGDFFHFFPVGKDQLGVVIGDVSGIGIPAALYMAVTITAIDTQIRADLSPGELLNKLNHILYNRLRENKMNVALQVATFAPLAGDSNDGSSKKPQGVLMTVASAGMVAPIGATEHGCIFLPVSGLPVGALSPLEQTYHDDLFLLDPFTTIIFTTNGIVEAQNETRELFGFDRLEATINEVISTRDAEVIAEHIINTAQEFIGRAAQKDDMTVVVVVKN